MVHYFYHINLVLRALNINLSKLWLTYVVLNGKKKKINLGNTDAIFDTLCYKVFLKRFLKIESKQDIEFFVVRDC